MSAYEAVEQRQGNTVTSFPQAGDEERQTPQDPAVMIDMHPLSHSKAKILLFVSKMLGVVAEMKRPDETGLRQIIKG